MREEIERAILQTLIYSDIFDYPLSQDELWRFLINKKIDKESFDQLLEESLPEKVNFKNNFYCLKGRENIVQIRLARKIESRKKIVIATKIIKQLTFIPTIQFIGISGALSLENSSKEDDIDLFVIASKGSLWLTRLTMIILLLLTGRYRKRNKREVSDKICLNMLIDESALSFSKARQNLYTAHEVVQMIPAFDRNDMYKKFMSENKWVGKFLPNALDRIKNHELRIKEGQTKPLFIIHYLLFILEHLAKALQLWSIKRHQTNETVSDSFLAFHPSDYKKITLEDYNKRLITYEI